MKSRLIHEFTQEEIHPEILPALKNRLCKHIQDSVIPTGEMVGVICAQSIGERQTQLTLNSFHQAGLAVNTVITGVPRFLEILNATKEPKVCTNSFQLKKIPLNTISDAKKEIGCGLRYITWKDLILSESLSLEKEDEPWYDSFEIFYGKQFRNHPCCFSFQLDIEKLHVNQISFETIRECIQSEFQSVHVVFSPLHIGQVDVFVDTSDIIHDEEYYNISSSKREMHLRLFLQDVFRPRLTDIPICGVPKILDYFVQKNRDNLIIDTEGSNMKALLRCNFIDSRTLRTNHMWEVYQIFGIEGTRKFLFEELKSIVSSDGTFINECHLMILVDLMTSSGTIQSISRYGVKKEQNSVLTRSSFEESLEHFSKAAFFSEQESIKSVSASIMCGKRSQIGTGTMSVMVDWKKL